MSRQALVDAVLKSVEGNAKVKLTQTAAGNIVSAVTEAITTSLRETGTFALHGFGTFRTVARAARSGRNPRTGETLNIGAKKSVSFKPHGSLKADAQSFAVAQPRERAVSQNASIPVAKTVVKKKK